MDVGCWGWIQPLITTGCLHTNRGNSTVSQPVPACNGSLWSASAALHRTLNRLSAGSNTFFMISSRNSLKTPSWSIPASSTPRSFTNFTLITPFMAFWESCRSCSYPSYMDQRSQRTVTQGDTWNTLPARSRDRRHLNHSNLHLPLYVVFKQTSILPRQNARFVADLN